MARQKPVLRRGLARCRSGGNGAAMAAAKPGATMIRAKSGTGANGKRRGMAAMMARLRKGRRVPDEVTRAPSKKLAAARVPGCIGDCGGLARGPARLGSTRHKIGDHMGVLRKQGVFWVDYYVNGRRKRGRIGPDKKLAEVVLKKRKVEIAEGKYLDKKRVPRCTFHELAALYLPWAKTNHRGYVATRSRVAILCQTFGDQQLSDTTPLIVDGYIAARVAAHKPATVNRDVVVLRHVFTKAMAWGKALHNPVAHAKPLQANNRRLRYLSHEEKARLLEVADDELRHLLITALQTGLRRGELFHLTWQDIDFKQGVIRVVQTKSGKPREIPMSDTLRETLQHLPRRIDSGDVFPGKTG